MKNSFFSKVSAYRKEHTMLLSILLSYSVVSIFLLSLLSVSLLSKFTKKTVDAYIASHTEIVDRTADTMDLLFSDIYESTRYFFEHDSVLQKAMYETEFSQEELVELRNRLAEFLAMNPYLYSIYIMNEEGETVFTSTPSKSTFQDFYDQEAVEFFFQSEQERRFFLRSPKSSISGISLPRELLTVIHKGTEGLDAPSGGLIANISCSYLRESLGNNQDVSSSLYVTDSQEHVIFRSPDSAPNVALEILKKTAAAKSGSYFYYGAGKERQMIIFRHGDTFDFTYMSVIPYSFLLSDFLYLRRIILVLSVLLFLAGLVLTHSLARRISAPLYQLIANIRKQTGNEEDRTAGDLDYLASTYESLLGNVQSLSQEMETYQMNRLLTQEYPSMDEKNADQGAHRLAFHKTSFLVILFQFRRFEELSVRFDSADLGRFKAEITQALQKSFASFCLCKSADPRPDSIVLLLNHDTFSNDDQEKLRAAAQDAISSVRAHLKVTLYAGISLPVPSLSFLNRGYRQAVFAASCYLYHTGEEADFSPCVLRYQEVSHLNQNTPPYPIAEEKSLFAALKSLDLEQVTESVQVFFHALKTACPEIADFYLTQLLVPLANLFAQDPPWLSPPDFTSLKQALQCLDTLSEKQKYLSQLFQTYICQKRTEKAHREEKIAEEILEWIRQNYQNPDLSLELIALENHYSSSYLRRIFKDTKGFSPTDYLMSFRIEKAKELLRTTPEPAVRICEMIGISNSKYFYRIFKKATGYTTSDYRSHVHGKVGPAKKESS